MLRAVLIERASVAAPHVGSGMEAGPATLTTDDLELLETNIDDSSPSCSLMPPMRCARPARSTSGSRTR